MQRHIQLIVAAATAALAGIALAQTTGDRTRDAANAVGRAASAAVTPGDQDMGRNPNNRSGGLMGNDSTARNAAGSVGRAASAAVTPGDQDMGRNPANRSGGMMGRDRSTGTDTSGTAAGGSNGAMSGNSGTMDNGATNNGTMNNGRRSGRADRN